MKLLCINNRCVGETLKIEVGKIYDAEVTDHSIRVHEKSEEDGILAYRYTFSAKKSIPAYDSDGKPVYEMTEWYWENFFERVRDKNLNELLGND